MSDELPEGWAMAQLGALGRYINGRAFKPSEWEETGLPIIRIQNLNDPSATFNSSSREHEERFRVRNGDLLIAWSASLGAFIWPGEEAWLNQHIFRVEPNAAVCTKEFLFHAVRYAIADLYDKAHGTGMVHVTKPVFESHEIPLPPLPEQRRIVAKLEALLGKVDACQKRLTKIPLILKRFRQSVLAAACSGRLTEGWREENPEVQSAEELLEPVFKRQRSAKSCEAAHDVPDTWTWGRFEAIVESIRGGSTVPPQNEPTDYPILRSSSVRPGSVDFEDVKFLSEKQSTNTANYLSDGDLLFTRLSGSLEFVANCAMVRDLGLRRLQYPDRLFCAKVLDPRMAPYAEICFNNPLLRAELTEQAKSSAGHQRVSISDITGQRMPLPPLPEQHEIVRRVEGLFALADQIEARYVKAKAQVDKLTQSLLAKAFRGALVPTEAELARREGRDYEPAEVLLEGIG